MWTTGHRSYHHGVPDDEAPDDHDVPPIAPVPPRLLAAGAWPPFGPGGPRRCSFCNRREDVVQHLVRSRDAEICEDCLDLARGAIAAASPDQKSLRIRFRPSLPQDRDAAEEEIERVFETAIGGDTGEDERLQLIEDSSNLRASLQEVAQRLPRGQRPDTFVDHVRFLSEDEAEVHFVIVYPGPSAPRFPQSGYAVVSDGRWKVARETWCRLVAQIGVRCPPPQDAAY